MSAGGWQSGQWGGARAFLDHEHVVLMGDLNYRLGMPDEDARAALKRGDLQALREADELTSMRNSGAHDGLAHVLSGSERVVSWRTWQSAALGWLQAFEGAKQCSSELDVFNDWECGRASLQGLAGGIADVRADVQVQARHDAVHGRRGRGRRRSGTDSASSRAGRRPSAQSAVSLPASMRCVPWMVSVEASSAQII